jgi:predicted PurR-regulated permease PerM
VQRLENKTLLGLIGLASLAFAWILWPLFGAVFWAAVFAIVFQSLHRRLLLSLRQQPNLAAFATVLVILVIVVLPVLLVAAALAQETASLYARIQSGDLDFVRIVQPVFDALPAWANTVLDRIGITDIVALRERASAVLAGGFKAFATQAIAISQTTLGVVVGLGVMLYLLFFLLRDGRALVERLKCAIPLRSEQKDALFQQFTVVVRATVKGDILVAILQGALGGLAFWFLGVHASLLWAVLMAVLSLLPAIGAALVWLPVAIYFLLTGSIWQGIVLILYGALVIGLVDNLLRPILIGQDAKMPDYVVLISTLGGIETFGLHGFIAGPVIAAMFLTVWDIFSRSVPSPPLAP